MKVINVLCVFVLGWMIVFLCVFIMSGFYFEDWSFTGSLKKATDVIQRSLELNDHNRRFLETNNQLTNQELNEKHHQFQETKTDLRNLELNERHNQSQETKSDRRNQELNDKHHQFQETVSE